MITVNNVTKLENVKHWQIFKNEKNLKSSSTKARKQKRQA